MRLLCFLILCTLCLPAYCRFDSTLLYGQWKISVIDNGIFKMDMNDPGDAVHRMLMEERREGENVTVEDSLEELEKVNKIYGQFKNLSLRFKKNGQVLFNLGNTGGKDAVHAILQKGVYKWEDGKLIVSNAEDQKIVLTLFKLTATELELTFSGMEVRGIKFLFTR